MSERDLEAVIMANNAKADLRDFLLEIAEGKIQRILLDLDAALIGTGAKIESIRVDTHHFANLSVEIVTEDAE